MSEKIPPLEKEVYRTVVVDGVCLHIVATHAGEDGWELHIENELGVRSVWYETFPSAEAALTAGAKAIEDEGVEPFVNIEGFDYLSAN